MPRSFGPVGIIDIGSNSVRFVAYAGAARVPSALFNEKIMAALGRGVAETGELDAAAMERTLDALARFRLLAREMGIKKLHTVATAAVRDASNGDAFLKQVTRLGLRPRLLSGAEEAELSGYGVLSAIPRAHGVVADLGGGSLELIGAARGGVGEGITLPLGVLRLGDEPDLDAIAATIAKGIRGTRLKNAVKGQGLYLVGGSFRALAQLDLRLADHPLPIVHQHRFTPERLDDLAQRITGTGLGLIRDSGVIASSRVDTLPGAVSVLQAMVRTLQPRRVIVSAYGLREGILYRDLDEETRQQDPLLAAALEVGERLGRFGDHGAALDQWLDPLFGDESPELQRLRLAACLLGDIAWNAHPDFRTDRAVDLAVHGNWVGIDDHGRALLGRALSSAFGDTNGFSPGLASLLRPGEEERAIAWGKAIRLANRLSGGTEPLLRKSSIALAGGRIVLAINKRYRSLYADAVERRLKQLAKALDRDAELVFA